ncbi:MAG TPA: hypothetical protein VK824_04435 [Planctomycetota bacterium]|nr:hypothetical protein [Planctomycetota bacterium]
MNEPRRLCAVVMCLAVSALHAQGAPAAKPAGKQATTPVTTPAGADDFHAEIVALYGFQVGTLPQKEMEAKSGGLDAFWDHVKADKAKLGPALRLELAREDVPGFFLYDGSMLLLELGGKLGHDGKQASRSPVDKGDAKIVIAAMARCSFNGLQPLEYVRKIHWLASEGNDTTAAAFHVLDEPGFQAFIPQHALTLGQDFSLVCMLLPTDEAFWLAPALERLKSEKDGQACKSLLKLTWYAATDAGDAAIRQVAEDEARPKAVRQAAAALEVQTMTIPMKFKGDARAKVAADVKARVSDTIASLKAARRKRMQGTISDEALSDLDQYTLLIRSHAP